MCFSKLTEEAKSDFIAAHKLTPILVAEFEEHDPRISRDGQNVIVTCSRCGGDRHWFAWTAAKVCFRCNGTLIEERKVRNWARSQRTARLKAEKVAKIRAQEEAALAAVVFVDKSVLIDSARELAERQAEARRLASIAHLRHVGEEGEKVEIEVRTKRIVELEDRFRFNGTKPMVIMTDRDGNDIIWFTSWGSSALGDLSTDEFTKVRAQVKQHKSWNDRPQTVVTRVKALN